MNYNSKNFKNATTLRDYLNYKFDVLYDPLERLDTELSKIAVKSGPKPNAESVKFMVKLYREYWFSKDSVTVVEVRNGLSRNLLSTFIRRNGLDVKYGEIDVKYFEKFGMSRIKYKEKWGSYSNDIEEEYNGGSN